MSFLLSIRRTLQLLSSPERNIIATIVDDPLKVRKEVRFLLLRLAVFMAIVVVVISASIFSIRRGVMGISERRILQQGLYARFESMARLSHDVTEGRTALEKIQGLFPKDDNLLPFLKALEALAKETGNTASFRFEGVPTAVPDMAPYRTIGYVITLAGDARTFLQYLSAFHDLPYLVVLDGMMMTGDHGLQEKNILQVKGRLYVQ